MKSEALIDVCKPHRHLKQFPQTIRLRRQIYQRVAAHWNELGFSGQPAKTRDVPSRLSRSPTHEGCKLASSVTELRVVPQFSMPITRAGAPSISCRLSGSAISVNRGPMRLSLVNIWIMGMPALSQRL